MPRRDPLSFIRDSPPDDMMDPEEHLRFLREMRAVDTRDAWAEARRRNSGDSRER